ETASVSQAGNAAKTLAEIFDTLDTSTIVSITDAAGDITYMNKFFLDVARYRNEELVNQSHRILKSGFHDPALFEALWKTIAGGKSFSGYVRNKAKDGSIYWVKTTISPTFEDNGQIKGYVGVRTPITELMVLFGVEAAIQDQAKGKKLDKKMTEIVKALKYGNYTVQANF
ncbi:MAG: PAS domain-containing protein, partial [Thaumarchaeota archaeon]|nr:PAS domain-containing protein [Nitrososphaerota archaeon]